MRPAPIEGRPRGLRFAALLGLALLLTQAGGCRKDAPGAPPEDAAERIRKAEVLHHQAETTAIPEKYDLLRRVIALYDDTKRGQDTYLELVVTLVRDQPPRLADAIEIARKLSARHPSSVDVTEAWRQIADTAWAVKDAATRKATLDAWSGWLQEHDVAGDVPKAQLYLGLVNVRIRQERWDDALVAADTALNEPGVSNVDRVEVLVRKGNLLADKLGRKSEARAAFEAALDLARRNHAAGTGLRGLSPDQIEGEIKRLDKG